MFVITILMKNTSKQEINNFIESMPENIKLVEVNVKVETDLDELSEDEKKNLWKSLV